MATPDEDVHARPTTASIDRRVERLETRQDDMQRSIDRIELTQKHSADMNKARFDLLDANVAQATGAITSLKSFLEQAMLDSAKMMGDASSTPAGRAIVKDIEELQEGRRQNYEAIQSINRRFSYIAGGLAVIMFLIQVFAPMFQKLLGIPGVGQ